MRLGSSQVRNHLNAFLYFTGWFSVLTHLRLSSVLTELLFEMCLSPSTSTQLLEL